MQPGGATHLAPTPLFRPPAAPRPARGRSTKRSAAWTTPGAATPMQGAQAGPFAPADVPCVVPAGAPCVLPAGARRILSRMRVPGAGS